MAPCRSCLNSLFLRGLAHDIKTPLATIMAYSRALGDGLVQGEQFEHYLETLYKQSYTLKDRLDDMMTYASLEEQLSENMLEGDLLEAVRRYVGENFTWFSEREADIEIRFEDSARYVTNFDPASFSRLLQNIFVNSVQHNKPGVSIYIDWDAKEKCLRLGWDEALSYFTYTLGGLASKRAIISFLFVPASLAASSMLMVLPLPSP